MMMPFKENWELSGIYSEAGNLDRPLAANQSVVPGIVEISGGKLRWWHERVIEKTIARAKTKVEREKLLNDFLYGQVGPGVAFAGDTLVKRETTHTARVVSVSSNLLEDFVKLSEKPDTSICEFARKWGLLGICEHGLPRTHSFVPGLQLQYCDLLGFRHDEVSDGWGAWEPLAKWRDYSGRAIAILDIAASLHRGKRVRSERTWRLAFGWVPQGMPPSDQSVEQQKFCLSILVNKWLEWAAVRPFFSWSSGIPAVVLRSAAESFFSLETNKDLLLLPGWQGITLFPALAVQLLMAVSRTAGFAVCSSCGTAFAPKRRPNPNRRRYCQQCGLKAAWRDAQAARRAKRVFEGKKILRS